MSTPIRRIVPLRHPVGPAPPPDAACAAWSHHAAELAVPIAPLVQAWQESPSVQRMVADGELARLLPSLFVPPDLLGTAIGRVIALGCAIGAQLRSHHVVAGASAAWVHLGGEAPDRAELLSTAHRGVVAGTVVRHARLRPGDVETIGGGPVTPPARTAVDLLRFERSPGELAMVARLLEGGHVTAAAVRRRLGAMHPRPGSRAAERRLARILERGPSRFVA